MTTALVRAETGEVIAPSAPFDMGTYLADLRDTRHVAQQQALAAVYDAACLSLIGPNDVHKEGGRTFKKKSAWRKLARHFAISTEVVKVEKEIVGEFFCATATVRAVAPWGQYAEEVGACSTDEATGRRTISVADAIATASTRATNRAVSNLIAMGEVSAEEIGDRAPRGGTSPDRSAAEKKMPFGKQKGTALGEIDTKDLQSTIAWATGDAEKAEKFKDLVAACREVISSREGGAADDEPDYEDAEFPG